MVPVVKELKGDSHYKQLRYWVVVEVHWDCRGKPRLLELSLKGCAGVCQHWAEEF